MADSEALAQQAEESHAIHTRILASLSAGREALWALAESFYELDERCGWQDLGYETLGDYLGDPEIAYSRNHYNRLVRLHKQLVVQRGLDSSALKELDYTKVSVVMPALESGKVKAKEAIADACALSRSDLRDKYVGKPKKEDESQGGAGEDTGNLATTTTGDSGQDGEDQLQKQPVSGEVLDPEDPGEFDPKGRKERDAAKLAVPEPAELSVEEKAARYDAIIEAADQLDCIAEFEVARQSGAMTPRVPRSALDEVCEWVKSLSAE